MNRIPKRGLTVAIAIALLAAAGCSGDDDDAVSGGATSTEATGAATAESTEAATSETSGSATTSASDESAEPSGSAASSEPTSSDTVEATQSSGIGDGLSIAVVGGPLSDPFFSAIDRGGKDASETYGADYEYLAPQDFSNAPADLANLTQTAIQNDVDILVIGDFIPPAQEPDIQKAVDAGITVVIYNSGADRWQELGAVGFVGEDAAASGAEAGRRFAELGAKNVVCVNHVPENPVLQVRCDSLISTLGESGGTGQTMTIPSSESGDQQGVTQKIAGFLRSNPDVDGVFTLGTAVANAAVQAVDEVGVDIPVATTDVSLQAFEQVKSGDLAFLIDQQPYLQTYYGVQMGIFSRIYGLAPTDKITTSPLVITQDNVDFVIDVQKTYGIRGAS